MIFPDVGELETLNCVVAPPPHPHYRYFYLMQRGQEISEKSPSNQRHMAHQSPEHGEGHGSVGRTTLAQFLLCKGLTCTLLYVETPAFSGDANLVFQKDILIWTLRTIRC